MENKMVCKTQTIQTSENCYYGCGNLARYITKQGTLICSKSPNQCPVNRRKNSLKGKESYKNGSRISGSERYKNLSSEIKERMKWNKGLTKNTDLRVSKQAETAKERFKNGEIIPSFKGRNHTSTTKKKMSKKRIEYLTNHNNYCEWFTIDGISLQGSWEYQVALWLKEQEIDFARNALTYQGHRRYTPDFYIPKYDFYIEVKGFMRDNDKRKMFCALKDNNVDIKIIERENYMRLNELSIDDLPKFVNLYSKDDIDFSNFIDHWGG